MDLNGDGIDDEFEAWIRNLQQHSWKFTEAARTWLAARNAKKERALTQATKEVQNLASTPGVAADIKGPDSTPGYFHKLLEKVRAQPDRDWQHTTFPLTPDNLNAAAALTGGQIEAGELQTLTQFLLNAKEFDAYLDDFKDTTKPEAKEQADILTTATGTTDLDELSTWRNTILDNPPATPQQPDPTPHTVDQAANTDQRHSQAEDHLAQADDALTQAELAREEITLADHNDDPLAAATAQGEATRAQNEAEDHLTAAHAIEESTPPPANITTGQLIEAAEAHTPTTEGGYVPSKELIRKHAQTASSWRYSPNSTPATKAAKTTTSHKVNTRGQAITRHTPGKGLGLTK